MADGCLAFGTDDIVSTVQQVYDPTGSKCHSYMSWWVWLLVGYILVHLPAAVWSWSGTAVWDVGRELLYSSGLLMTRHMDCQDTAKHI